MSRTRSSKRVRINTKPASVSTAMMDTDEMFKMIEDMTSTPGFNELAIEALKYMNYELQAIIATCMVAAKSIKPTASKMMMSFAEIPEFFLDAMNANEVNMSRCSRLGHLIFCIPIDIMAPVFKRSWVSYKDHIGGASNILEREEIACTGPKRADGSFEDNKMQCRHILNQLCKLTKPDEMILKVLTWHIGANFPEMIKKVANFDEMGPAIIHLKNVYGVTYDMREVAKTSDEQKRLRALRDANLAMRSTSSSSSSSARSSATESPTMPTIRRREEASDEDDEEKEIETMTNTVMNSIIVDATAANSASSMSSRSGQSLSVMFGLNLTIKLNLRYWTSNARIARARAGHCTRSAVRKECETKNCKALIP